MKKLSLLIALTLLLCYSFAFADIIPPLDEQTEEVVENVEGETLVENEDVSTTPENGEDILEPEETETEPTSGETSEEQEDIAVPDSNESTEDVSEEVVETEKANSPVGAIVAIVVVVVLVGLVAFLSRGK